MDAGLRPGGSGSGHSAGGPSSPTGAGPSGPASGGGSGPSASGPTGGRTSPDATPASTPDVARGPSTKDFLTIHWDYAVYDGIGRHSNATAAKEKQQALARNFAIHCIAGDDPRPLLVLRECPRCNKTDRALLTPGVDNERTLLLSRWFHCVKLPLDVIEPDHPFHALFSGERPEHLFVSLVDGSSKVPLEADTSRAELWAAMTRVLDAAYARDITLVSKDITRHFDRLDVLDQRARDLEKRRDDLMQTLRVDPARVTRLAADLEDVKKAIGVERAQIEKLTKVEMRAPAPDVAAQNLAR
jgi:hypothetical protein